jgi:uncharacterized protein (DUF2141 family)
MKKIQTYILTSITILIVPFILSQCTSSEKPEMLTVVITADTLPNNALLKDTLPNDALPQIMRQTISKKKEALTPELLVCCPLKLVIKNLSSPTAPVIVGIYKSDVKFLYKESRLKEYTFIPNGNELTIHITDVCYGEYAIAVYQDENSNGKFDKNFIGMPKEPYAFSNNFAPKIKAPSYDDCKFKYDSTANILVMTLIK